MATIIFKNGEQIAVEYHALNRHLAAGWSTSESQPEAKEVNAEAEPKPKPKRRAIRKKV